MKRREYLATLSTGAVVGTTGCFWEDGTSNARLAAVSVSNYYDSSQRFVIHIENDGEDALTAEIELDAGGNNPTSTIIDCGWSTEPSEYAVEIIQLSEPRDSVEVFIPGKRTNDQGVGNCVGVDFLAGFREFDHIEPRVASCEEYTQSVELCVDEA